MKTLIMGTIIFAVTGCAGTASMGEHAEISGSPKALQAMFVGLNGALKTAKEGADSKSQYFEYRAIEEREQTARDTAPGILSNLFNRKNTTEGS